MWPSDLVVLCVLAWGFECHQEQFEVQLEDTEKGLEKGDRRCWRRPCTRAKNACTIRWNAVTVHMKILFISHLI